MPPKTPEQLEADFRREQRRQLSAQSMAQLGAASQPAPLVNNYMGPPEAPTQVEEPARAGPTGFVGFGQQLGANVEASQRMAQQTGKAALESGSVDLLGTESGRQALLQKALGKAAEASPLDAALAGAAGGDYFGQLQAEYGPEAQARRAADMAKASAEAKQAQQKMASKKPTPTIDPVASEAARLRSIDANRPRGQVSAERWANLHGMTLEQWIKGGKQPAY